MLNFEGIGDNANKKLYDNIQSMITWARKSKDKPLPSDTVVSNVTLRAEEKTIKDKITDAYLDALSESKNSNDSENGVFLRLQQLHDEAKLISAMYISTMSRDQLMGFTP